MLNKSKPSRLCFRVWGALVPLSHWWITNKGLLLGQDKRISTWIWPISVVENNLRRALLKLPLGFIRLVSACRCAVLTGVRLTGDSPGRCEGGVPLKDPFVYYPNITLPNPYYTQKLALYTHLLSGGSDFTTFSVTTKGFEELQTYLTA